MENSSFAYDENGIYGYRRKVDGADTVIPFSSLNGIKSIETSNVDGGAPRTYTATRDCLFSYVWSTYDTANTLSFETTGEILQTYNAGYYSNKLFTRIVYLKKGQSVTFGNANGSNNSRACHYYSILA